MRAQNCFGKQNFRNSFNVAIEIATTGPNKTTKFFKAGL